MDVNVDPLRMMEKFRYLVIKTTEPIKDASHRLPLVISAAKQQQQHTGVKIDLLSLGLWLLPASSSSIIISSTCWECMNGRVCSDTTAPLHRDGVCFNARVNSFSSPSARRLFDTRVVKRRRHGNACTPSLSAPAALCSSGRGVRTDGAVDGWTRGSCQMLVFLKSPDMTEQEVCRSNTACTNREAEYLDV